MINRDRIDLETYYQSLGIFGEALEEKISEGLRRIDEGYPLAYLIKEAYFYDLVFTVDENVLIPRPDTEHIFEAARKLIKKGGRFADLGTGSGCIAVTLAFHRPDLSGVAVDISEKALTVAKKNAHRYGVDERLSLFLGDIFKTPLGDGRYDLIISNPPYIPTEDIKKYPSLVFEPQGALDGGEDGMNYYRAILTNYRENLEENGGFLFEIGYDQGEAIRTLAESLNYKAEVYKDFGKNDRVALIYPIHNS